MDKEKFDELIKDFQMNPNDCFDNIDEYYSYYQRKYDLSKRQIRKDFKKTTGYSLKKHIF